MRKQPRQQQNKSQSSRETIKAPIHMTQAEFVASGFQRACVSLSATLRDMGADAAFLDSAVILFGQYYAQIPDEMMARVWQDMNRPENVASTDREAAEIINAMKRTARKEKQDG